MTPHDDTERTIERPLEENKVFSLPSEKASPFFRVFASFATFQEKKNEGHVVDIPFVFLLFCLLLACAPLLGAFFFP
jgi:hypothetical protein